MTDAEIDALEAGVELDKIVADACGIRLDHNGLIVPQLTGCAEINFSQARRSFGPSFDWNDAMRAAENTGLFEWGAVALWKSRNANRWAVADVFESGRVLAADGTSGPVAICRAILKAVKNAST